MKNYLSDSLTDQTGETAHCPGSTYHHTVSAQGEGALTLMVKPVGLTERQPVKDGIINLSYAERTVTFDGHFSLIIVVPADDSDVYSVSFTNS